MLPNPGYILISRQLLATLLYLYRVSQQLIKVNISKLRVKVFFNPALLSILLQMRQADIEERAGLWNWIDLESNHGCNID